jgi:HlyD family secretion protein
VNHAPHAHRGSITGKLLLPLVVIGLLLAGGYLSWWYFFTPVVEVAHPVRGPVVQAFYSTGTVEPVRDFAVRTSVEGIVTEMRVDKGSRVKAGDILAVVEDPKLKFAVERARAELAEKAARAEPASSPVLGEFDARIRGTGELVEIAQREQRRMELMVSKQAASQTDLDRALDRTKTLQTEVESFKQQRASRMLELTREADVARAMLSTAQAELDKSFIRAPGDGVILDRPTGLGSRVAINDTLMTLADVSPANLVMRAQVDEEDVAGATPGQEVRMTLYAFGSQVFTGTVQRVYERADTDRRTFEVDVKVDMAGRNFSAGMTGELAFILQRRESAMTVPAQAVQMGGIWRVERGALVRTAATIGLRSIEVVEVLDGLSADDLVVISPLPAGAGAKVRTSQRTSPTAIAPPPTPAAAGVK